MSDRDNLLYLNDILDSIDQKFAANPFFWDVIVRKLPEIHDQIQAALNVLPKENR